MNRLVGFSCFLALCGPTFLAASHTEREGADAYFFDQPQDTGQRLQLFLNSYAWADRWEVGGRIIGLGLAVAFLLYSWVVW